MDNSYFNWKQKVGVNQDEVKVTSIEVMDMSGLVRTKETGDKVYLAKDGIAHWITSPEVLKSVGGDWGQIQTIDRSIFRQLQIGEKLTMENATEYSIDGFWGKSEGEAAQETAEELKKEGIPAEPVIHDKEFKQYEEKAPEEEIDSAPKETPEKGLTSIIIPAAWIHYPAFHYTGNCIGAIREHTDKEKTPYEIILVINGKTGISVDRFEQTYADKVIQLEENVGYAKAVNRAIRVAKGEYIAIVNNDVQVFQNWLADMQLCLNQPDQLDLVMATPMYGEPFARAVEALEKRNKHFGKQVHETFDNFIDFSCILTKKEVFQEIGLFDEQFFMYCEDIDFMRRMEKADMKYASTKLVNTAHIIGATSSAIKDMPEIMNDSKEKLKKKWGY
jgi:cellulose synthase/poly-beta-1,6-N-acetylglucosamine synthase-like glycosyltransferase